MRKIAAISVILSSFMLNACAYSVHDVYVSGFEPYTSKSAGKVVSSHSEQFVVLGFKGNTDYLEVARQELEEQCPKGEIVGIVTEYQTALGFMSWHHHIYMKGLCTNAQATSKKQAQLESEEGSDQAAVESF